MTREDDMTKMQAIEMCAKAMLRRQGCEPATWFQYPANTELAANIVTALDALGLLPKEHLEADRELQAVDSIETLRQPSNSDA
jgi:hypothetical protein